MLYNDYTRSVFSGKVAYLNIQHVASNIKIRASDFVNIHGYIDVAHLPILVSHYVSRVTKIRGSKDDGIIRARAGLIDMVWFVRDTMGLTYFPCSCSQEKSTVGLPTREDINEFLLGSEQIMGNLFIRCPARTIAKYFPAFEDGVHLNEILNWWESFITFLQDDITIALGDIFNNLTLYHTAHSGSNWSEQTSFYSEEKLPVFANISSVNIKHQDNLLAAVNFDGAITDVMDIINQGVNGSKVFVEVTLTVTKHKKDLVLHKFFALIDMSRSVTSKMISDSIEGKNIYLTYCSEKS